MPRPWLSGLPCKATVTLSARAGRSAGCCRRTYRRRKRWRWAMREADRMHARLEAEPGNAYYAPRLEGATALRRVYRFAIPASTSAISSRDSLMVIRVSATVSANSDRTRITACLYSPRNSALSFTAFSKSRNKDRGICSLPCQYRRERAHLSATDACWPLSVIATT
jgi:hypothetical protein